MVAFSKVRQKFGASAATIGTVIHSIDASADESSCNATMNILNHMMCPAKGMQPTNLTRGPTFDPSKAVGAMRRLIEVDEPIFVSIKPDHHFTVMPLSGDDVTILQGFQESYTLHEWINSSGKIPIDKSFFLDNFSKLFSGTALTAQNAAVALFGVPGKEQDIRDWYPNGGIVAKSICSSATDMFSMGGAKATLADP